MKGKVDTLVGFLGAPPRGYKEATYIWDGQTYTTPYCPEALVHFFQPARMVVVVTPTARELHYADLELRLAQHGCQLTPAPIPEVSTRDMETTLWEIFNGFVKHIWSGERIIFDVTYGYRFVPMLVLLAGQFLNVTREAQTAGIFYGAFEARNERGQTPLINLKPLADLMDWTQAAAHFETTGNASPLIDHLDRIDDDTLKNARWHLFWASHGLRLGQATQIGDAIARLLNALDYTGEVGKPAASPVYVLIRRLAAKYAPLATVDALKPEDAYFTQENAPYHLRQQAVLLSWYVQNDQLLHAWLLAREWLVTWTAMDLDLDSLPSRQGEHRQMKPEDQPLLDQNIRRDVADWLNEATRPKRWNHISREKREESLYRREQLATVRSHSKILDLWVGTVDIRNQMAHMSMRSEPHPIIDMTMNLRDLMDEVLLLVQQLPLTPMEELLNQDLFDETDFK